MVMAFSFWFFFFFMLGFEMLGSFFGIIGFRRKLLPAKFSFDSASVLWATIFRILPVTRAQVYWPFCFSF